MKAIIFDFDGTLADSSECGVLATQQAFKECKLPVPTKKEIDYYMGIPIEQSFQKMSNHTLNDEQFKKLLKLFRQAYKTFEEQTITAFPQIKEVVSMLHKKGFLLFVVSSKKTDVLHRNLQKLELDYYFTDWIGSDQVEHYKPHPEGILILLDRYSLKPEEAIMVGDTIFDLQMAKAAGVHSCGVTWGSHPKEKLQEKKPTFLFDEVQQLAKLESLYE